MQEVHIIYYLILLINLKLDKNRSNYMFIKYDKLQLDFHIIISLFILD